MHMPPRLKTGLGSEGRKQGRHSLDWTASRQRKLVRLIDCDVPWINIAEAMAETNFTPSRSTCLKQWEKITDMPRDKLRVKDPEKRARRKAQALKAFEDYQKRRQQAHSALSNPPIIPPLREQESVGVSTDNDFFASVSSALRNEPSPPSASTPSVRGLPNLTSNELTPKTIETYTPRETQEIDNSIVVDEPMGVMSSGHANSPAFDIRDDASKRQPISSHIDSEISGPIRQQYNLSTQSPVELGGLLPSANQPPIPEEDTLNNNNYTAGGKSNKGISKLEEKLEVPPGFINFVKDRLSIARTSIASALSSSGSVRSRWSFKLSRQMSHDPVDQRQGTGLTTLAIDGIYQPGQVPAVDEVVLKGGQRSSILCNLLVSHKRDNDEETAELIRSEIDKGADVNMPNDKGVTPLHQAVALGNYPVCELLLEKGANVYAKTNDGIGISSYGKIFERKVKEDTSLFVAIRACRNLVRDYGPGRKSRKTSKRAGDTQSTDSKRSKIGLRDNTNNLMVNSLSYVTSGDVGASQFLPALDGYMADSNDSFVKRHDQSQNNQKGYEEGGLLVQDAAAPETLVGLEESPLDAYDASQSSIKKSSQKFQKSISPKVRERVKAIESRQSAKSTPLQNAPQHGHSSSRQLGESSKMTSPSDPSTVSERAFSIWNAPQPHENNLGFENVSHSVLAQYTFPAVPPQLTQSQDFANYVSEPNYSSNSSIVLSGYLEQGSDGRNFLVCPLLNDSNLQYLRQASKNCMPAPVQIVWPPQAYQASEMVHEMGNILSEEPAASQVISDPISSIVTSGPTLVPSCSNTVPAQLQSFVRYDSAHTNPNPEVNEFVPFIQPAYLANNDTASEWQPVFSPSSAMEVNMETSEPDRAMLPSASNNLNPIASQPPAREAPNQMLLGLGDRLMHISGNAYTTPLHGPSAFQRVRLT